MVRRWAPLLGVVWVLACSGTPVDQPADPDAAADTTSTQVDSVASQGDSSSLTTEVALLRQELSQLRRALVDSTGAADNGDDESGLGQVRFMFLRVTFAMLLLIFAYYVILLAVFILDRLAERTATRRLFFKRLVPMVRLGVWAFTVYYVVSQVFDVDRTSLVAGIAAIGVALGFAAQDVLKNIFGGVIIILDRPFQVGDKVKVDDTYGEVVSIGLRATRIVTPDDNLVSVPNLKVVEGTVANANAGALDCQVVVNLYLPGWVDVAQARTIAYDAAASSRFVFLDKPIVVNVADEFRETFLTRLIVKAYVFDTRYEFAFASDVTETAKRAFQERGLIPELFSVNTGRAPA